MSRLSGSSVAETRGCATALIRSNIRARQGESSQAQITFTMELTAAGDRTRVRVQMDFQPRGVMVPMSKIMCPLLMRGRAQRAMEGTFANAKRILEVGPVSSLLRKQRTNWPDRPPVGHE